MIVVYRIGQLGDTLAALPAIYKIKEMHLSEKMLLLTNVPAKKHFITAWDVLKYTGCFDKAIYYNSKSFLSLLNIIITLRNLGKSNTLYYLAPFRSQRQILRDQFFFEYLCGIKKIISTEHSGSLKSQTGFSCKLENLENESLRLLRSVVKPDQPISRMDIPKPPFLFPSDQDYANVSNILGFIDNSIDLIIIAHGSKMPAKKWSIERYKLLISHLIQHNNAIAIILLGGIEDYNEGELIRSAFDSGVTNLSGRTTIMESAAILARSRLYVGSDTGTMHLAAVMGVSVVALFSARDNPGKWEPLGENHTVIRKNVPCAGCMLEVCPYNNNCMELISEDEVLLAVIDKLEAKTK